MIMYGPYPVTKVLNDEKCFLATPRLAVGVSISETEIISEERKAFFRCC